MCNEPWPMLRGCHHLRGASLSACERMYRTIVRVTRKVRRKAIKHHISGHRSRGTTRSKFMSYLSSSGTGKTYADLRVSRHGYPPTRRCAPIVWSGHEYSAVARRRWLGANARLATVSTAHRGGVGLGGLATARPHPVSH